jgi:phage tail sheath protein FI
MHEDHLGLLNSDGVNVLRGFPGRGIRIWGARTTSDDPDWKYINVRRLFIMLRRSLEEGTQWVVFEPNEPRTWERLTTDVDEFLKVLWGEGYFAGDTPTDSYFIRCNADTNPRVQREAGQLLMEVGVAPALPTEYIIFNVVQKMGDQASQTAE